MDPAAITKAIAENDSQAHVAMLGGAHGYLWRRQQTRDFTFVSDTAGGILAAGLSDASVGRTLNLGSEKEIEIQLLAKMISEVLGSTDPVYGPPPWRRCAVAL